MDEAFFARHAVELAPDLLGKVLHRRDGRAGRIVEVEAYGGRDDPASHAFRGPTARNRAMFGPPGRLYVYLSYGVHRCANVVAGPAGEGTAVLIRALDPLAGLDAMRAARWTRSQRRQVDRDLCRGPGRLAEAMGIDDAADGLDLGRPGAEYRLSDDGWVGEVASGVRIGISRAVEFPWRFWIAGHVAVSGPSGKISRV